MSLLWSGERCRRLGVAASLAIGLLVAAPVSAGTVESIECGQVIESALDPDDTDLGDGTWLESFDFVLEDLSTVSVLMTGEGFDPYVIITDDDSVTLHEGEPPRIEALAAGAYRVFANNLAVLPPASYAYTLSLSCSDREVERIECGQTVAGQLEPSDEEFDLFTWIDPFDLTIEAPTRVRFQLLADSFDPLVIVRDTDGNEIGSDVEEYVLDLDPGTYSVLANNFFPVADEVHPYRLSMSCAEASCPGDCDADGDVSIADLVRGVRIALGEADETCPAFDTDDDREVSVSELVAAVRAALDGCLAAS